MVVSGICSVDRTIDVFAIVPIRMHEDAGGRVGWVRVGVGTIGHFVGLGGAACLIEPIFFVVRSLVVAIAELDHDILAAGDGTELGALERTVEGVACGKRIQVPVRLVAVVPVVTGVIIAGVEYALIRFIIARVVHRSRSSLRSFIRRVLSSLSSLRKSASGDGKKGSNSLELFVHL